MDLADQKKDEGDSEENEGDFKELAPGQEGTGEEKYIPRCGDKDGDKKEVGPIKREGRDFEVDGGGDDAEKKEGKQEPGQFDAEGNGVFLFHGWI